MADSHGTAATRSTQLGVDSFMHPR
jgi:hypothetical protein